MKIFFTLLIFIFSSLISLAQPTISSFSPTSGPIGTIVTINGNNFSSTVNNNIVFFGAVKAVVLSATSNILTVSAPSGASYTPISITSGGLTGYSKSPFILTFAGGTTIAQSSTIYQNCFDEKIDSSTDLKPNSVAIIDFDGDGKPDIATANDYSIIGQPASVSILRNIGSGGSLAFSEKQNIPTGALTFAIAVGDLNGDGKPDMVSSSIIDKTISIFINTSTIGNISFNPKIDLATVNNPFSISISDIDSDGKADIAIANASATDINYLSVFRNISSGASVSFAPRGDVTSQGLIRSIAMGDIDGDLKPDAVLANGAFNTISVFKNTSVPGSISFANRIDFASGIEAIDVSLGDLDGDDKIDIGIANNTSNNFSILRNTSSAGVISFAAKVDYNCGASPYSISIADLNGDAKPDVVVPSINMSIRQNTSSIGNISLGPNIYLFLPTPTSNRVGISDLNNDGKSDMVGSHFNGQEVSLIRNKNNEPSIIVFSPSTAATGSTIIITGMNFSGVTSVTFGGIAATSFTIINSTTISAIVGAGFSGKVEVGNQYGTSKLDGFVFAGPPIITSFTPLTTGVGQSVTITGNNFSGTTSISFGGVPASSYTVISPTTITAIVGIGNSGNVNITTPFGTGSLGGFNFVPLPTITSFTPSTAGPTFSVSITGTNFTGATSVSFGGVSATSFIINSPTSITAIVGTGATGNVNVTTSFGTATKAGFIFVPAPTITSFTPLGGNNGSIITVNGTNLSNITSVTVGGVSYTSTYIFVSSNQIKIPITVGATGSIIITTLGGTAALSGFVYNPQPTVSSISPSVA